MPIQNIWDAGINLDYLISCYHAMQTSSPEVDFWGTPDKDGRYWIDLLSGSDELRVMTEKGMSAEEIKDTWREDIEAFKEQRRPYLLYDE